MARTILPEFGTALRLGTTSSVAVSGNTPTVTAGLTICFWINLQHNISAYPASATRRVVLTTDDAIDIFVRQSTSVMEFKLTTTQGSSPRPTIAQANLPPNQWVFVAAQYDAGTGLATIYTNNVLRDTETRDGTNLICNNTWQIGDPSTGIYAGIDDVYVYNFAFSSTQRTAAMNGSFPTTGQVFGYKLNEGSGTTAIDSSGNGKNGTISNATYINHGRPSAIGRYSSGTVRGQLAASPNIYPVHNGIATDGTNYYGLHTSSLKKFDADWDLTLENANAASDANISHIGGGQYYNGFIYAACENYTSPASYSSQRISVFNATTLAHVANHDISAQGNEVSGLCIDPEAGTNGIIYVSSFVQSGAIYMYDLLDFSYLGSIPITPTLVETQDITVRNGYFYMASVQATDPDMVSIYTQSGQRLSTFNPYMGGGAEGVDYTSDYLLVLDENSSLSTSIIRSFSPSAARIPVDGNLIYNGNFELAPAGVIASTTTSARWIDGTAAGNAYDAGGYYGWAWGGVANKASALFDTAEFHSGTRSLKLSVYDTAGQLGVQNTRVSNTPDAMTKYGIKVSPNTSYTFTGWMKTEYISGDATNGAAFALLEKTISGGTVTTRNTSYIKTTTPWTQYTLTFTTNPTTQYITFDHRIYGHQGTATLLMNAWIDDLVLNPTTPLSRTTA